MVDTEDAVKRKKERLGPDLKPAELTLGNEGVHKIVHEVSWAFGELLSSRRRGSGAVCQSANGLAIGKPDREVEREREQQCTRAAHHAPVALLLRYEQQRGNIALLCGGVGQSERRMSTATSSTRLGADSQGSEGVSSAAYSNGRSGSSGGGRGSVVRKSASFVSEQIY